MNSPNKFQIWAQQIRAPFLVLSIVLVLIGAAAAFSEGFTHWWHFAILTIGVILAHVSVNLFNELSDYQTKIDEHTERTPFSGGSGMQQAGHTTSKAVKDAAYGTLVIAFLIGIYFSFKSGWPIFLFMIIGGISVLFYTTRMSKMLIGEVFTGMTLGSFVVLGSYYALTGHFTGTIVLISIPPGILTSLLLFLNEFPDADADKQGGRHHLVIHFGKEKSARIYIASLAVAYAIILVAPFTSQAPFTILIALLTIPMAVKAGTTALKHYDDLPKLVPALGMNVGVVILTDLLLAIGYFI